MILQADARHLPLDDQSVDLVFGSPPYTDCRLYLEDGKDLGISRNVHEWVEWMLNVTTECLRICRGPVVWVAAGPTRKRNYWPACEGLMWEWFKRGGSMYRPCYWKRYGIPGSGGDQWFRADVEYVMCFKRPGKLPWTDNTAMGHPCKYGPGGDPSHRMFDGARRRKGGSMEVQHYTQPVIANPGTLIDTGAAGGGNMGSDLCSLNEAPFPEKLAEHFILSLCPPNGIVCDCFSGSGTTAQMAITHGRKAVACDLRFSQCELTKRRIAQTQPVLF